MSLAARLREIREWYGLSVRDLASLLDVHFATYSKWEKTTGVANAPRQLDTLAETAWRTGVSVDWLLAIPTAARWGPSVMMVRRALANCIADAGTLSSHERARWLVEQIQSAAPDLIIARRPETLFACDRDTLADLFRGRLAASPVATARIADMLGLSEDWLLSGRVAAAAAANLGEWGLVARRLEARQVGPSDIVDNMDILVNLIQTLKQRRASPPG